MLLAHFKSFSYFSDRASDLDHLTFAFRVAEITDVGTTTPALVL
jgi:hypothetical protein